MLARAECELSWDLKSLSSICEDIQEMHQSRSTAFPGHPVRTDDKQIIPNKTPHMKPLTHKQKKKKKKKKKKTAADEPPSNGTPSRKHAYIISIPLNPTFI